VNSGTDNNSAIDDGVSAEDLRTLSDELYASLRHVARMQRGRNRGCDTLQTTALVSEAYVKLSRTTGWKSRTHFLNTAAVVMRQVLVDYARARLASKRGGGQQTVTIDEDFDEMETLVGESSEQVLSIDLALTKLQRIEPRLARLVEYRFFAGYNEDDTAELMGVSTRTVQREWLKARAWLYQHLDPAE